MPTYEYACASCAHEWEEIQRITEAPIETCPQCGKPTAHRLISAGTNFILKGGGWYSDLYASPKAAGEKPVEAKTETKNADKAPANGAGASESGTGSTATAKPTSDGGAASSSSSSSSSGTPSSPAST